MDPTERFWTFSVRAYRSEGVPAACLDLQDQRGADVNVLLYCMWVGATRGKFDDQVYDAAMRYSEDWCHHVVAALRGVRTWMKQQGCHTAPTPHDACMALREKVKGVEFAAEKMQEEALETLVADLPAAAAPLEDQIERLSHNLRRYCADKGIVLDAWSRTRLAVIAAAAVNAPDPQLIDTALSAS